MHEADVVRPAPDTQSVSSRETTANATFDDVGESQFIDMEPSYYRVPASVRAGTGTIGHKAASSSGTGRSDMFGHDDTGFMDI